MLRYFKYEMKKIWKQWEVWFVLIGSVGIGIIGFFNACQSNSTYADCGTTLETVYSAERYTLLGSGSDFSLIVILCIMPIFATLIASASLAEEKKNRLVPILVSRNSRPSFYSVKGIAISITAFLGSTLPFLFSGLFSFLAVPIKEVAPMVSTSLYENSYTLYSYETGHMLFPSLYLNSPVFNYLAHVGLIGLYGMGLALLAYGISFFFHKSPILLMLLPMLISFAVTFLLIALSTGDYVIIEYFSILPNPDLSLNAFGVLGILLGILLLDLLLIFIGIKRNEDVL